MLSVIPTGLLLGDDVDDVMGKGYLFGVGGGGRWPINQGFVYFCFVFFLDNEYGMGWLVLYDRELIGKSKLIFIVMQFRFIYTNIICTNATAIQLLNKWS